MIIVSLPHGVSIVGNFGLLCARIELLSEKKHSNYGFFGLHLLVLLLALSSEILTALFLSGAK